MSSGTKSPSGGSGGHHCSTSSSHSSSAASRNTLTHWFTSEIQQMMHGFGDCRRPLAESAGLIEEVVHQQMIILLQQVADIAAMRNARFIGVEDLLFLLRKDKVKLRRLLRYMELKDLKAAALKGSGLDDEETNEIGDVKMAQPMKRRKKICYDFLSSIDQTGELIALFDDDSIDDVKHERLLRAELQSRSMETNQYIEFCEARQVTFSRKYKSQRFKEWLMSGVHLDIKPNPLALEVISYLTYETVAQLVDLSLLVKQDMRARAEEPLSHNLPNVCINYQEILPNLGSRIQAAGLASPTISPPSTPSTPGVSHSLSSSQSQSSSLNLSGSHTSLNTSGGGSSSSSKSKSKKRKKSGPATILEWSASNAILPSDIREALRRYGRSIGPFGNSVKMDYSVSPKYRLLCC